MKKLLVTLLALVLLTACSSPEQNISALDQMEQAAANAEKGLTFLKANSTKEGVITTASGLQYKIIRTGSGKSPQKDGYVTVDYRGTTIDGKEFDSSYARGKPMIFQTNRVIPGWTEALQLMKKGAKWQLFIPEDLAYGAKGAGSAIGPRETLIFEVELLTVH